MTAGRFSIVIISVLWGGSRASHYLLELPTALFRLATFAKQQRLEAEPRLLQPSHLRLQFGDLAWNQLPPPLCHRSRSAALSCPSKQHADFSQAEARALGKTDQVQTVNGIHRVPALARGSAGRRQQSQSLVVTQRGGPHADLARRLPDGELCPSGGHENRERLAVDLNPALTGTVLIMKDSHYKLPVLLSAALSVAALEAGAAKTGEPTSAPSSFAATPEVPFLSCTLAALNEKDCQHHGVLLGRLRAAITERRELPDGYAFNLGAGFPLADLAEWISLERRCCPFFGFTVEAKPGSDNLWLQLTGGGDVKTFIQSVILADGDASAK